MKIFLFTIVLLLGFTPIYGQKIYDEKIEFKKDCSNCKFLLAEASKAYETNFKEALKDNKAIHKYVKELIDLDKISDFKLKAEYAFRNNNTNSYYTYIEKLKTISLGYISDFTIKSNGESYIYIELNQISNNKIDYNIYVDSGVKYGKIRIYYNLETNQLAHIKVDNTSYKKFMENKNRRAEELSIWLFKDYNTFAYVMNRETKADNDFLEICDNFIEYKNIKTTKKQTLIGARKSTTTAVSLTYKNCE